MLAYLDIWICISFPSSCKNPCKINTHVASGVYSVTNEDPTKYHPIFQMCHCICMHGLCISETSKRLFCKLAWTIKCQRAERRTTCTDYILIIMSHVIKDHLLLGPFTINFCSFSSYVMYIVESLINYKIIMQACDVGQINQLIKHLNKNYSKRTVHFIQPTPITYRKGGRFARFGRE